MKTRMAIATFVNYKPPTKSNLEIYIEVHLNTERRKRFFIWNMSFDPIYKIITGIKYEWKLYLFKERHNSMFHVHIIIVCWYSAHGRGVVYVRYNKKTVAEGTNLPG
jgi:hypothetical protein